MAKILLNNILLGDFKGVLFDKDGTLCNSEKFLLRLARSRVKEIENQLKDKISDVELQRLCHRLGLIYGIKANRLDPNGSLAIASTYQNLISTATGICLTMNNWSDSINIANKSFSEAEIKIKNDHNLGIKKSILPGVKKLLINLESANLKCGIISNDTNKGIKDFLIENNIEKKISGYWSCENQPSKPDPEAIKQFCKILNLEPSECLLIGDSDSDLRMAREAGIGIAAGYVSGWVIEPDLKLHQNLISDWNDITCP